MTLTTTSKLSLETIKLAMQEKAKEHGFGLLKSYEFNNMLKEKGFELERKITVFELCNPATAQVVLEKFPELSVYLPCRISVYEDSGLTTLATIGLDEIMQNSDVSTEGEGLGELMRTTFNRLKSLMNDW